MLVLGQGLQGSAFLDDVNCTADRYQKLHANSLEHGSPGTLKLIDSLFGVKRLGQNGRV